MSGHTAEGFKGDLDGGSERLRWRGEGVRLLRAVSEPGGGEAGAERGAGGHGRRRGRRSLSGCTPPSESSGVFLKLKESPAAPWGPCWSCSHGAGTRERASAQCWWPGRPKEAAFLPAEPRSAPWVPRHPSSPVPMDGCGSV